MVLEFWSSEPSSGKGFLRERVFQSPGVTINQIHPDMTSRVIGTIKNNTTGGGFSVRSRIKKEELTKSNSSLSAGDVALEVSTNSEAIEVLARQGERMSGEVRRLNPGYGFISCSKFPKEVFFHRSELKGFGFDLLSEGDAVEFEVTPNEMYDNRKLKAINIIGPLVKSVKGIRDRVIPVLKNEVKKFYQRANIISDIQDIQDILKRKHLITWTNGSFQYTLHRKGNIETHAFIHNVNHYFPNFCRTFFGMAEDELKSAINDIGIKSITAEDLLNSIMLLDVWQNKDWVGHIKLGKTTSKGCCDRFCYCVTTTLQPFIFQGMEFNRIEIAVSAVLIDNNLKFNLDAKAYSIDDVNFGNGAHSQSIGSYPKYSLIFNSHIHPSDSDSYPELNIDQFVAFESSSDMKDVAFNKDIIRAFCGASEIDNLKISSGQQSHKFLCKP